MDEALLISLGYETSAACTRLGRLVTMGLAPWRFTLHAYGETTTLPPKDEMFNFSLRAKYELDRLPQIQKNLMDQENISAYRAYPVADRLASIEGRLYFEALRKGAEPPFNMPFMAQREFNQNQNELPQLMKDLSERYFLPQTVTHHFSQDILRYRENHGENPSCNQLEKMVQIAQKIEAKDYRRSSYENDSAEKGFLHSRERELLFRHGLDYDASRNLDISKSQANKSLERMQKQMERDRQHQKQMDLGL